MTEEYGAKKYIKDTYAHLNYALGLGLLAVVVAYLVNWQPTLFFAIYGSLFGFACIYAGYRTSQNAYEWGKLDGQIPYEEWRSLFLAVRMAKKRTDNIGEAATKSLADNESYGLDAEIPQLHQESAAEIVASFKNVLSELQSLLDDEEVTYVGAETMAAMFVAIEDFLSKDDFRSVKVKARVTLVQASGAEVSNALTDVIEYWKEAMPRQ